MKELVFESKLTQEEIDNNFKDFNLFDSLVESLNEIARTDKVSTKFQEITDKVPRNY